MNVPWVGTDNMIQAWRIIEREQGLQGEFLSTVNESPNVKAFNYIYSYLARFATTENNGWVPWTRLSNAMNSNKLLSPASKVGKTLIDTLVESGQVSRRPVGAGFQYKRVPLGERLVE